MNFKSKQCKECGKTFTPRCGTQVYCNGPHVSICEFCGSEFEYTCSPKEKPKYCSKKCNVEGKKLSVRKKYGVDNVAQLDEVRQRISEKNSSEETSKKRKQTCLERYGVDNPAKSDEIKEKLSKVMKTDNYLKNREATCLKRYGTASPMQNDEVIQKRSQSNLEKYGMLGPSWSIEHLKSHMIDPSKAENYLSFKNDPYFYLCNHYSNPPTIMDLRIDLGVTDTPIYDILIAHNCSDMIKKSHSSMEDEVYSFLSTLTTNIIRRDRTIIVPYELDFYLPEFKIGIECNPAATHNSSIPDPWGAPPKSYRYHKDKSLLAKKQNIFLFHIFGYEWKLHDDVIKSMLTNLLNRNTYKIGARNTYIEEISYIEAKRFLDENHRQGNVSSKVRIGLKDKSNDEIISLMTFGKLRNTLGKTSDDVETWELSRFCNKKYTSVAGSASKLLKYFINKYHPIKIVSFSDIAHTSGKLYKILGFHDVIESNPNYVWSNQYDTKYYNRVSCQKHNLSKLFKEDIDIENHTEREIMEAHKFVQVFDCGTIRWELDT